MHTRRTVLGAVLAGVAGAAMPSRALAALRIPVGGVLRLPLPAPRRTMEPARAVDVADAWPLALVHDTLATALDGGGVSYPWLTGAPVIDRADPRVLTVTLRQGIVTAAGTAVDARSLVAQWTASRRASPLSELVFAMCDTTAPFVARSEREIRITVAAEGLGDEVLSAWPLSVTGLHGSGIGPFRTRADGALERNPRCPAGAAYLTRIELAPPRDRNEELRAFVTGSLDGSWRGHALYDVARAAGVVRGSPAGVVGLVATRGGLLDDPARARALERALAALSTGTDAALGPMGFAPDGQGNVAALATAAPRMRLGRDASDGVLAALAERVVALLDAQHIQVALVGATEPADTVLRAVAPIGTDPALAVAAFLAVAGDPAGASVAARTPRAGRSTVVTGAWARGSAAVLGRVDPLLHVRDDLRDARFDGMGRLLLGDAWLARVHR